MDYIALCTSPTVLGTATHAGVPSVVVAFASITNSQHKWPLVQADEAAECLKLVSDFGDSELVESKRTIPTCLQQSAKQLPRCMHKTIPARQRSPLGTRHTRLGRAIRRCGLPLPGTALRAGHCRPAVLREQALRVLGRVQLLARIHSLLAPQPWRL